MKKENNSSLVGITEITERYLPISKRRARRFVSLYLQPIRIGNRIFVDRQKLEKLLNNQARSDFPLEV
jgi:hypothetical protein